MIKLDEILEDEDSQYHVRQWHHNGDINLL